MCCRGTSFLLLKDSSSRTEVDDAAAREMISMSFRDRPHEGRREQANQPEPRAGVTMTLLSMFNLDFETGDTGQPAIVKRSANDRG
jgi:hypothetical protein